MAAEEAEQVRVGGGGEREADRGLLGAGGQPELQGLPPHHRRGQVRHVSRVTSSVTRVMWQVQRGPRHAGPHPAETARGAGVH